mmetsp:Transcript_16729/g.25280  ORF Transcript_16729/g.25280 Transcript_16729/m.25280 type:complete len:357 (+) Transcript_16729:86-1156(+)
MPKYEIPTTMKRLVVTKPGKDVASCQIEVEEVPVPKPKSGEVLVKVIAAPVNPSDYGEWYRTNPEKYPITMGKEGCGIVVASGGGLAASFRVPIGTKVGITNLRKGQGTYSEYVTASASTSCFPMPNDVTIEDCASFFVNPYTAVAILDIVKNKEGCPAFVHTAAASQLGQMIVKLAPFEGVDVINVVRRQEQADILKELGAEHIVISKGDNWKEELKTKMKELDATCAFDAVSGDMTGDLLDVLPPKYGTLYTYGGLAGNCSNINPMDLIYRQKQLKGFMLAHWIKDGGTMSMISRMMSTANKVNCGLKEDGWASTQFIDTSLEKAHDDIVELLGSSATGKKLRVRMNDDVSTES